MDREVRTNETKPKPRKYGERARRPSEALKITYVGA